MSLEEYQARYANESGYEFWFGEVVRKGLPTWFHAVLQGLLTQILYENGYIAGSELDLRVSRNFQPKPDVAAALEIAREDYPTKPVDIVIEILSPDDAMATVMEKCAHYTGLGIAQIYVFDPVERWAAQWDKATKQLPKITELRLTNASVASVADIFARFDERLKKR